MHRFLLGRFPPLFLLTCSFISGIAWHIACYPLLLPVSVLATLALACLPRDTAFSERFIKSGLWALIFFLIGALRSTSQEAYFLSQAQLLCNKKITLTGTIVDKEEQPGKKFPLVLTIAVTNITYRNRTFSPEQPLIKLYCHESHAFEYNDVITIPEIYLSYPGNSSFGYFLKKQNICANGFLKREQPITFVEHIKAGGLAENCACWVQKQKDALIAHFQQNLSPEAFILFSSIFLGYKMPKTEFTCHLRDEFQWWGISHHLARSGLHLVMFILVLQFLLLLLPIPLVIKKAVSMLLIFLYTLFSWSSISFIRSLLMVFCYFICTLTSFASHALHTISLACCIILLYNPFYLLSLDFQLSFSFTLALALFHDAYLYRRAQSSNVADNASNS